MILHFINVIETNVQSERTAARINLVSSYFTDRNGLITVQGKKRILLKPCYLIPPLSDLRDRALCFMNGLLPFYLISFGLYLTVFSVISRFSFFRTKTFGFVSAIVYFYRPRTLYDGMVMFSVCLSVHQGVPLVLSWSYLEGTLWFCPGLHPSPVTGPIQGVPRQEQPHSPQTGQEYLHPRQDKR